MKIKLFIVIKVPYRVILPLIALGLIALFAGWQAKATRPVMVEPVLPLSGLIIAVDPGHGGYDPGTDGFGIVEKDLVLEIGFCLRDYLQQGGARVIMTRELDVDFLLPAAGPKKRLDLSNRLKIVEQGEADLLISLHANYISSARWQGSQVFYQENCSKGKALAASIQAELQRVLQNTDRQAKSGDYYMLRESSMPGVIVEVGFLSNPGEAALLKNPDYQKKLAWAIYLGIIAFLATAS